MISKKLILLCLITFNFVSAQQTEFSLTGKTAGIEDGSYLYFKDLVNGGEIDSAMVKNNSFKFDTALPEPAMFTMLFTKDRSHFTEVWLEDNPMTFDASNGNFKEAKVTGSKNHGLFKELTGELWADYLQTDKTILKQRERDFIKNNPDAIVSIFLLFANDLWSQKEIGEAFSTLTEEVQNSSIGQKKIAQYLEKDLPQIGEKYLDFKVPASEGDSSKISELTGKLTLLQFWSSHCSASRMMNFTLSEVYKKHHPEGLEIISIAKDIDKEEWQRAIKEDNLSWSQLSNLEGWDGEVLRAYGVHATPSNFLINSEGVIIARNLRGDELGKRIEEELKK